MEERSSEDLITAGLLVFIGLACVIAILYLSRGNKGSTKGDAKTPNVKTDTEGEIGTVFVKEEDGRVVRRSTRQHKPVTPLGPRLAAAAADAAGERDVYTPKRGSRTPRASSSKTAQSPAADPVTPRSAAADPVTPRRRGRPPKATA